MGDLQVILCLEDWGEIETAQPPVPQVIIILCIGYFLQNHTAIC